MRAETNPMWTCLISVRFSRQKLEESLGMEIPSDQIQVTVLSGNGKSS